MDLENTKYFKNSHYSKTVMDRKAIASEYFRILWYSVAQKVVNKAIEVYELDEKQADALKKVYLKPNHYYARIK